MVSPFLIYFAGIGTVVAALGVGFGGGLFLTGTDPMKEGPRAKDRPEIVAKQDKPELPIATTPVTVRTPEENKAAAAARDTAKINEPKPAEPGPAKPESAAATDERAAPAAGWGAAPPPETTGSATTSAPALPVTAPLTPPAAQPAIAAQPVAPSATVTIRRGQDAEERVTVSRDPRATARRIVAPRGADEVRPVESRPAGIKPTEPKSAAPKAHRKLREADRRKTGKPRPASEDDEADATVERVVAADPPETAPPAPPPMRDAGSLRGF